MKDNIIQQKSYAFALRIINICTALDKNRQFVIATQLLKSGTSIGANVEEAIGGQSKLDFLSKISIAYKEARETHYWLRLLRDSTILDSDLSNSLISDCEEILRIVASIQKSTKNNNY